MAKELGRWNLGALHVAVPDPRALGDVLSGIDDLAAAGNEADVRANLEARGRRHVVFVLHVGVRGEGGCGGSHGALVGAAQQHPRGLVEEVGIEALLLDFGVAAEALPHLRVCAVGGVADGVDAPWIQFLLFLLRLFLFGIISGRSISGGISGRNEGQERRANESDGQHLHARSCASHHTGRSSVRTIYYMAERMRSGDALM
mmetsp:Transcript_2687/g.7466  ORF Transcript_2687/g.7466 Transcript_2687/m.7466 type:complete len:202 (+) Transcript_2687:2140-2745(+)